MDVFEQCTRRIGLCLRPSEVARLEAYAREKNAPTLSAAIRAALPDVFLEPVREGRAARSHVIDGRVVREVGGASERERKEAAFRDGAEPEFAPSRADDWRGREGKAA
jgi:hypothetical protein